MKLLAIDPGTRIMGLALFDGPVLVGSRSLTASPNAPVETRLNWMMHELGARVVGHRIQAIAIERPGAGNPAHRPPTLLALCTFIRLAAKAMSINWMNRQELTQAIPPVYTFFVGRQLRKALAGGNE